MAYLPIALNDYSLKIMHIKFLKKVFVQMFITILLSSFFNNLACKTLDLVNLNPYLIFLIFLIDFFFAFICNTFISYLVYVLKFRYILYSKTSLFRKPVLCKQKEFNCTISLF